MTRVTQLWRISGGVQGVGFRDWLVGAARGAGVAGWVRNAGTGEVEALVQGEAGAVAALLEAARRGPPLARVTSIAVAEAAQAEAPPGPGFERVPDRA